MSSLRSVELIRFIPCSAVHSAVFRVPRPPDPLAETVGVRLDPKEPGRVGEHRPRIGFGKALTVEDLEEDPRVLARHVGLIHTFAGHVAEVAVPLNDLLG